MIKVLHVISGMERPGGVQTLLYNYYSYMDREKIRFDFIVHTGERRGLQKAFEKMGCKVYRVTPKKTNLKKHISEINKIMKQGNYDIIHTHQNFRGFFSLYCAKKNNIGVRITHCHRAFPPESLKTKAMRIVLTKLVKIYSTHLLACGRDAAIWLYGKPDYKNGKVIIVRNGIEVEKFKYNVEKRAQIRKELNLNNKFVIGHVGNFYKPKNHKFLVEIFAEVCKIKENAVLLLIGAGILEQSVKEQIKELGLSDNVIMLGSRNDVYNLLNAMDVFVLPSVFEGFGIAVIEAQTNGLPCIVSDKVPKEINIEGSVKFLSLNLNPEEWANEILKYEKYKRVDKFDLIKKSGYDVADEAKKLEQLYCNMMDKKE